MTFHEWLDFVQNIIYAIAFLGIFFYLGDVPKFIETRTAEDLARYIRRVIAAGILFVLLIVVVLLPLAK